ncbi:MAG: hypothetical protein AB1714_31690 [Acidobacteriota bacterium]
MKVFSGGLVIPLIVSVLSTGLMADGTVEEAGISIVEVPMFVTDRDGNPVLGLTEVAVGGLTASAGMLQ